VVKRIFLELKKKVIRNGYLNHLYHKNVDKNFQFCIFGAQDAYDIVVLMKYVFNVLIDRECCIFKF
jgi:hypothetical protein